MHSIPVTREALDRWMCVDLDALVEAARANPAAFAELYYHYLDRVYAYVRARTADEATTADVTQQIFVQALEALPRYRGGGSSFAPWLFRIAHNTVIDFYRRRHGTVSWDQIAESMQPTGDLPLDATLLKEEALTRLRTLLARLDEEAYALIVFRFAGQLTLAEIASITGKSEAATQRRLHRLMQTLKEHYRDEAH